MKYLLTFLFIFSLLIQAKSADQVYVMPHSGGNIASFGQVALSASAAVVGVLGHTNGGTDITSAGTGGNQLVSNNTGWTSAAVTKSYELTNVGLLTTLSSNALIVSLKQKDGATDCSASAPCKIGFRNTTANLGSYSQVLATSALSMTIPASATLGLTANTAQKFYVYAVNNSGTLGLGVSATLFDNGTLQTVTQTAASVLTTLYGTLSSNIYPIRLIGRVTAQTAAPNWVTPTEVSVSPFINDQDFSNGNGPFKIEIATITESTNCLIANQSGTWISSTTYNGTGDCTLHFTTGNFLNHVSCVANPITNGNVVVHYSGTPSSTSAEVLTNTSTTGTAVDTPFSITCIGGNY